MKNLTRINKSKISSGKDYKEESWQLFLISLPSIIFGGLCFVSIYFLILVAAFLVFGLIISPKQVGINEVAVKTFFGKIKRKYERNTGLIFVCWYTHGFRKTSTEYQQAQFPGEPENIFWGDPRELPEGKVLPIWVNTASPKSADYTADNDKKENYEDNQLHSAMRVPFDGTMTWCINDVNDFIDFIMHTGKKENFLKMARDLFERIVNEEGSKRTLAMIIKNRGKIDSRFKKDLQNLVDGYDIDAPKNDDDEQNKLGATIINAQMLDVKLDKAVKDGLDSLVTADLAKKVTITNAEATKKAKILEGESLKEWETLTGEGKAAAAYYMLKETTKGFKERASELGVPGNIIVALAAAMELMQKGQSNTIIYGDNPLFGQLFATIPALKDLLTKETKGKEK